MINLSRAILVLGNNQHPLSFNVYPKLGRMGVPSLPQHFFIYPWSTMVFHHPFYYIHHIQFAFWADDAITREMLTVGFLCFFFGHFSTMQEIKHMIRDDICMAMNRYNIYR